tara:strand:+ start:713 stop:973 length:261 start_codon:yes stop_codon:yes gene_type:complete
MKKNKYIKYARYDENGDIIFLEEALKIVWYLNPELYPNLKKKVSFELDGSDGNLKNFDSTIIGLIGFVLQVIHHLEHHEEKVVEYN